ncbi:MAG: hypothetical protein US70_C0018G0009 [Parcubacteria group bacterium GW2011_GWD2_38_11]|nr:MAG: hypothetical protein US70_C0018G0009 [Parcubacteria group bacterium GW2011_GWD2_38_11]
MEEEKKSAPFESQPQDENVLQQSKQVVQLEDVLPVETDRSISIGNAFDFSWKSFKSNMKFLLLLALSYFAISVLMSILQEIAKNNTVLSLAFSLLGVFVSILISIGIIQVILKISRGNQAKIAELLGGMRYFWKFIGGGLLYCLILLVGYILFIIPGIVWQMKYGFFQYLIIDKDMGPIEAIKESGKITYGFKWQIFFLHFVIMLLFIGGILFFGVGIFVAYPLSLLMMTYAYRRMIGEEINVISSNQ